MAIGLGAPAQAALRAVGPVSAAHGYPIWYSDTNDLALDLCIDGSGMCLAVLPNPLAPPTVVTNAADSNWDPAGEAFYWSATALIPEVTGVLVLALEAAFGNGIIQAGQQITFARIRYRFTPPASGNFTITHPFGEITVAGELGVRLDGVQDIGIAPGIFTGALLDGGPPGVVTADGRSIGPFLTRADGTTVTAVDQATGVSHVYLSNPNIPTAVTGSPLGTNFFRIVGPGVNITQTQFALEGKISGCGVGNLAPVATPETVVTDGQTVMTINVLANDTDDSALDPATLTIVAAPAAGTGTVVANANGTVTYDPQGATTATSFTYTVQDRCGLTSNVATVTIVNGGLIPAQANYRTRTGKWSLAGTSNTRDMVTTAGTVSTYSTTLTGPQEVPPVTTAMTGDFSAIFDTATPLAFDYQMNLTVPAGTTITQAHIHEGAAGVIGPPIFFVCSNLAGAPVGTPACTVAGGTLTVTRTLTGADLQPTATITTFGEAVTAIQGGATYVNAHSPAHPTGEVRGQIGRNVISLRTGSATGPAIGAAEVQADNTWSFNGKAQVSPGAAPHLLHAESALGVTATSPLRLR
jgi:hypothetical protein